MSAPLRGGVALLLAHQAESGAFPACATFSQYPYSWLRDGTFIAYALDRAGEHTAAERYYRWVAGVVAGLEDQVDTLIERRKKSEYIPESHFLPTRFALNGEPLGDDWPNFQLDGYGQWLWGLSEHLARSGMDELPVTFRAGVRVTLRYLEYFWNEPCFDCWEEFPFRWHTSTLASLYGGMKAMSRFFPEYTGQAERIRDFILEHAVQGGTFSKFVGFPVPDASLLWTAVPFGVLDVHDPVFRATLGRVEAELLRDGVHRYPYDTYYGGGSWVLLTAWLGWVYARQGRPEDARRMLTWVRTQDTGQGLPEQTQLSLLNPTYAPYWRGRWGEAAQPLLWSHAMHIVLETELTQVSHPLKAGTL